VGIDYIIDYDCAPKRGLTREGLVSRLKARERAEAIIQLYRDEGDARAPAEMGFEMVRRAADGSEETEVIVVQDLLDMAAELEPWEPHCTGCPANLLGVPFGCVGSINYPISAQAERWLLDQLPDNEHPLVFVLLQKILREQGYSGATGARLRSQAGMFVASDTRLERDVSGVHVTSDQVFEILFLSAPVRPAHAALLLQLFGGIARDLDADTMLQLAVPPSRDWIDEHAPFLHQPSPHDDASISELKAFFEALYAGFRLGVPVLLDV
jgi:hypothetical protein